MLVSQLPAHTLVEWVRRNCPAIRHPWDRPWYLAHPPPEEHPHWMWLCECYAPVLAARYREGDDPMCLYVGQCPDCQRILWTWYER